MGFGGTKTLETRRMGSVVIVVIVIVVVITVILLIITIVVVAVFVLSTGTVTLLLLSVITFRFSVESPHLAVEDDFQRVIILVSNECDVTDVFLIMVALFNII